METVKIKEIADQICGNIEKVIVGKSELIQYILTAILAGGHVLLEDYPGTGKTMLAKAVAKSVGGSFRRVQFTPDLMPSDITGLNIYNRKNSEFELIKGPVFTNVLLADEINRATPRTQSSLLEAMEEKQVTIDGVTLKLDEPFLVLGTENPIETTGTYPLPEAQLDRFIMKLSMGRTDKEQELMIIERYIENSPLETLESVCKMEDLLEMKQSVKEIFVHSCIRDYIVNIILATRESKKLSAGASTRATLALVRCCQAYAAISGRSYVEPDDVRKIAPHVLGHRVIAFGGGDYLKENKKIITEIVAQVEVPVENWEKEM